MIVMDLTLNNIFGFGDFHINFSYPKKIVNSIIENEYLAGRPNFRYKKAVILMGANATGKTSLGKALLRIFKFIGSGNTALLFEMTAPDTIGSFCIDFINAGHVLHRLSAVIDGKTESITLTHAYTEIGEKDTYEKCAKRLDEGGESIDADPKKLKKRFGELSYRFAYPEIESTLKISGIRKDVLLRTLKAVIGTLDPTLTDVSVSKDLLRFLYHPEERHRDHHSRRKAAQPGDSFQRYGRGGRYCHFPGRHAFRSKMLLLL